MGGATERSCDVLSALIFIAGLVAGTVCIIASKLLFEGKARGITGEVEPFQPPVFESFIMFFGELRTEIHTSRQCMVAQSPIPVTRFTI